MNGEDFPLHESFFPSGYFCQVSPEFDEPVQPGGLEPKKNAPQPFVQIEHDQADVDDAFAGVGQLGHDPVQRAFAFEIAKLAFYWNAVDLVLSSLFLFRLECFLVFSGFFLRPAQGGPCEPDVFLVAVFSVLPCPVDGVGVH